MIEDLIEKLLDRFENLLVRQQRSALSLLTEIESLTIPTEVVIDIINANINVLDAVYEIVEVINDMDSEQKERAWFMCSEAVSWANTILMTLDRSAFFFLHHLNIKGVPLLDALERLVKDMSRELDSLEILTFQERIHHISKVLKQQVELTLRSRNQVL